MLELFLFPFELIEKKKKIVIYGAGNVGRQFYNQVKTSKFCDVVLWVDKNDILYKELRFPVEAIEQIKGNEYDLIIIAIRNKNAASDVIDLLVNEYKVLRKKIIWQEYALIDVMPDYSGYIREDHIEEKYLKKINPKLLLNSDAMEHMVRYLFCRDLINGISNDKHISLYQRFVMTSTFANEILEGQTKTFSDYEEKIGLENYVSEFKKIVASMEKEGFLKTRYIPMGQNGYLANGKHRYAAALALEKDIWIRSYHSIVGHYKNIDWFRKNGFSEYDILMILRAFCDLYHNCGIYLIYGPVHEHWNYITTMIEKNLKIVGYSDLDFKDDYIGFSNLMRDNYDDNEKNLANIEEKIHYLLLAPLKIRVLIVTDELIGDEKKDTFYKEMRKMKEKIRNHMFSDTPRHTIIIHSSDGKEEFEHMKNIWLSQNNISYAGKRVLFNYGKMLVMMLDSLKKYLQEKRIPLHEICVVGSAGMELYGLKSADDLDFCVSKRYREYVDKDELPFNVHLKMPNSTILDNGAIYSDDIIIYDEELHFIYDDIKFINFELLYGMKKHRNLEKDSEDIRKLEVFFDSVKAFDEKRQFRAQMEREIGRIW